MADLDGPEAAFSAQVEQHCQTVEAADKAADNVSPDVEDDLGV